MRMIHKSLRMSIGGRLVVSVTLSVFLGIFISVQDSYGGYCDPNGTCCISGADCPPHYLCLSAKGVCSNFDMYTYRLCNVDSDCPVDEWCVPGGNCVGGESDGESCTSATGVCGVAWPPNEVCRTDEDCDDPLYPDCIPFLEEQCPGGACEPWATCPSCYIATAAFGSELEDKTDVLRSFRDKYLLKNAVGKRFVTAYYEYSPPLADYIAERDWLRSLVRFLLLPVLGLVSLFF